MPSKHDTCKSVYNIHFIIMLVDNDTNPSGEFIDCLKFEYPSQSI